MKRNHELRNWIATYIKACRHNLSECPGDEYIRGQIAGVQGIANLMGEISLETALRLPQWMYRKLER